MLAPFWSRKRGTYCLVTLCTPINLSTGFESNRTSLSPFRRLPPEARKPRVNTLTYKLDANLINLLAKPLSING